MSNYIQVRNIKIGEGIPKICVPIVGRTQADILQGAARAAAAGPDVAEWRADWFEDVSDGEKVRETLEKLRLLLGDMPLLFTFRTAKEGGEQAISPDDYRKLNQTAIETGLMDLVDVEAFTGDDVVTAIISKAHDCGVKVVASNHDFDQTPAKDEIIRRLCRMQELGADVAKIAVMPNSREDVLTLLTATEEMNRLYARVPLITMSMSGQGLVSRLCGEVFGSALTFAAVGQVSAPGQIDAAEVRNILSLFHRNMA